MVGRSFVLPLTSLCIASLLVQVRLLFQDAFLASYHAEHQDEMKEPITQHVPNRVNPFLRRDFRWDLLNGTLSNDAFVVARRVVSDADSYRTKTTLIDDEDRARQKEKERQEIDDRMTQNVTENNQDEAFSACLIVMDDNHYLIEWLAYHEHYLPLRRLIVAVDPRSRTSPLSILDRYKNKMDISVWGDNDFMPEELKEKHNATNDTKALTELYIKRQVYFYNSCLKTLHAENKTWTAVIDTDEFIRPNDRAMMHGLLRRKEPTMIETLQQPENYEGVTSHLFSDSCIRMPRIRFGTKESDISVVENMVPRSYSGRDFLTLRWRWHRRARKAHRDGREKTVVDVSKLEDASVFDRPWQNINPHRAIRPLCKTKSRTDQAYVVEAPFVVNHYFGTYEQWSFRSDPRDWVRHNRTEYEEFETISDEEDDSVRWWLDDFVRKNGHATAAALLQGVGMTAQR